MHAAQVIPAHFCVKVTRITNNQAYKSFCPYHGPMPSIVTQPSLTVVTATTEAIRNGHIQAPCAVVDVDAFDYNAAQMTKRSAGLPIRVASKSLRSTNALRRALSHPGYQGILAYSVPEALKLVAEGFTDIVVAYPCVDTVALRELAANDQARQEIAVMVDCPEHLDLIRNATIAAGVGTTVRVAIDIDSSLRLGRAGLDVVIGPRRSPLRFPHQVEQLAQQIIDAPELQLVGLMAYEGQVASVPDGLPGPVGAVKKWLRSTSMNELRDRRAACINAVTALTDLEFINGGGTGSLVESAAEGTLTELAAGSGFYTPAIFDDFSAMNHRAAAFFACQVSRRPGPGWVTVNSGGWIASGPPAADRVPVPVWPSELHYSSLEGAGEVQTPLHGAAADSLNIGDIVFFRHAKAGELTEHVNSILAVTSNGETTQVEQWDTYRGKGWTLR